MEEKREGGEEKGGESTKESGMEAGRGRGAEE